MHTLPPRFGAFQVRRALKPPKPQQFIGIGCQKFNPTNLIPGVMHASFCRFAVGSLELNEKRGEFVFEERRSRHGCVHVLLLIAGISFPMCNSSYRLRLLSALCLPSLPPHASFVCRIDLMKPHDTSGYRKDNIELDRVSID